MRGRHANSGAIIGRGEIEITDEAIGTYRRLLIAIGGAITTHPSWDGGLICEKRVTRARPLIWRISADGTVVPDSRYSFTRRAFIPAALPLGI